MADAAILVASSLLKPSSPPTRLYSLRPNPNPKPLLSNVRCDLTYPLHHSPSPPSLTTRRFLKYYARLASKLAGDGRFSEFLMVAESVLTSDAVANESPQFVARISTRLVAAGVCGVLRRGSLREVLEFLEGASKLGIRAESLLDEEAVEAVATECRRVVEGRRMEEFVELMEALAGEIAFL